MSPLAGSAGPQILIKDGPQGAFLFGGHFADPFFCRMLEVMAETAPPLAGNVMVVTEGYRRARRDRDLHSELKAVDVRTSVDDPGRLGAILGEELSERMVAGRGWADRIRARLGSEYDIVFGDAKHKDHLHGEHDPK
jgi:hypothetical protein